MAVIPADFPPTVSFTFDDAPDSAVAVAAPMLEAAGMRATWYLSAGLFGQDSPVGRVMGAEAVAPLRDRGHEIGCHTFSHLRASEVGGGRYAADIAANGAALRALLPGWAPRSFSFPYGDVVPAAKAAAAAAAWSCRTIRSGLARGAVDLCGLPGNAVYGDAPDLSLERVRGVGPGSWLILYTHDVTGAPSAWGCTPRHFAAVVEAVARAGLRVRPVGEVVDGLGRG